MNKTHLSMSGTNPPAGLRCDPVLIPKTVSHIILNQGSLAGTLIGIISSVLSSYRQPFYAYPSWYGCWYGYAGHEAVNLYDDAIHGSRRYPSNA